MATVPLSLEDIYNLANKTLLANGCDEETSNILSDLIMKAERWFSFSWLIQITCLYCWIKKWKN